MNKKIINRNQGFTLVEMLLAIGILVVLSGAILVSLSKQKEQAVLNKTLVEISSSISAMYMCLADGGTVIRPGGSTVNSYGGNDLCEIDGTLVSSYGQWPEIDGDIFEYYHRNDNSQFNNENWYVWVYFKSTFIPNNTEPAVCCNFNIKGCTIMPAGVGLHCQTYTP